MAAQWNKLVAKLPARPLVAKQAVDWARLQVAPVSRQYAMVRPGSLERSLARRPVASP